MLKEFVFARCGFFRCIYLAAQQVRRTTIAAFRKAWQSAGLPVGLQLVGKPYAEHLLLNVAAAYEKATPWHSKRPSLDRINPDENPQVAVPLARAERSLVALPKKSRNPLNFCADAILGKKRDPKLSSSNEPDVARSEPVVARSPDRDTGTTQLWHGLTQLWHGLPTVTRARPKVSCVPASGNRRSGSSACTRPGRDLTRRRGGTENKNGEYKIEKLTSVKSYNYY
jgi:hypothetical protein